MHVKTLKQTYRGIQIPEDTGIRKRKRRVSYGKGKRLS